MKIMILRRALTAALLLMAAAAEIFSQPPTNGLIAHWPFSGSANDASGNGHHGVLMGGPTLTTDRFRQSGSAYLFDGTNDRIRIPHHADLNPGSEFTISTWFLTCTRSTSQTGILDKDADGTLRNGYSLYVEDGATTGRVVAGHGNVGVSNYGGRVANGGWHHAVFVITTDSAYLYVDGSLIDDRDITLQDHSSNANDLYIGWIDYIPFTSYFAGKIDDIRLYNRALSASEVSLLYHENGWPSINGQPFSLTVAPQSPTTICKGDTAYVQVAGVADYYRITPADGVAGPRPGTLRLSPTQTTTYRIQAILYTGDAPCRDSLVKTEEVTITVRDAPTLNTSAIYACYGDTVTLAGATSGGTPPYRWTWTPRAGLSDSAAERPRVVVAGSAEYRVVVVDANGCSDTARVPITAIERPLGDIVRVQGADTVSIDTAYYCRGTAGVELIAEGSGGNAPYRFTWSGPNLDRTDSSHVLANPGATTTYILEVNDGAGLCEGYDTIVVIPTDAPVAAAGDDIALCSGESATLGTPMSGPLRFIWSPSDGLDNPSSARPNANPSATTTYTLRVTDTLTGCFNEDQITVEISDVRVAPAVTSLDFGALDGCRSDSVQTLRLNNAGASDGIVTSWRSDVAGVSVLGTNTNVPANGGADVQIRFAPSASGTYSGKLILYIGPCDDSLIVDITGSKEQSSLGLDLGAIDFGNAPNCDLLPRDTIITITNSGGDATIDPALISAPWSIISPSLPASLSAGQTLQLTLRYAPSAAGIFTDELRLPFAAGACRDTLRVALNGTVEDVALQSSTTSIDLGILDGCTSERDTAIELTNPSSFAITITSASLPAGYTLIESTPITIPAGGTRTIRIRFTPSSIGVASGALILNYLPCGQSLQVDLTSEKRGVTFTMIDTLDFGELVSCVGSSATLPLSILLNSAGTGNGSITSVAVSGAFTTDIANGTPLLDGQALNGTVTFTPTALGASTGEIVLKLEPCGVERRIVLTGISTKAEVTATDLDFGLVPSGSSRTGTVTYTNSGTTSIQIISLLPASSEVVVGVADKSIPATLLPGESITVEVAMTAGNGATTSGLNAFVDTPCDTIVLASIKIEGESSGFSQIVLPTLSASPGEPVDFRLSLGASSGLDNANAVRFRAEVSVEPSVLVVDDATAWSIVNKRRVIVIEGERVPGDDLLATVKMIATLGKVEVSDITLHSFEWLDAASEIMIDTMHGSFTLTGLCREGGVRLFDPEGEVAIKSVSPNPSRDIVEVRYGLSEAGETRMRIVDLKGATVREVFDGVMVPGSYVVALDVSGMSSSGYYLLLETPTIVVTRSIEIVR